MEATLTTPEAPKTVSTPAPLSPPSQETKAAQITTPEVKNDKSSSFDELDSLVNFGQKPEPEPKKEVKPQAEKTETVETKEVKTEEKKDLPVQEEKTGTAKELRAAYDGSKKRIQALEQEISELKKPKTPAEDTEKKALLERLSAEEKRRKEIEVELGSQNFEKSEEYLNKFKKPLESAFAFAHQEVGQLKVELEDGTFRPGTKEDFNKLLYLNTDEANKIAVDLFGSAASEVMAHRRDILKLNMSRNSALEEHSKNREKIEQERMINQEQQSKSAQETWERSIKEQVEKYPQFFGHQEGDSEGNELLDKGFKLVDLVFSKTEIPIEKRIQLTATVRNKAAAFDRIAFQNKKQTERIAELEKELQDYKSSSPEGSEPGTKTERELSWTDEIDEIAGKRK